MAHAKAEAEGLRRAARQQAEHAEVLHRECAALARQVAEVETAVAAAPELPQVRLPGRPDQKSCVVETSYKLSSLHWRVESHSVLQMCTAILRRRAGFCDEPATVVGKSSGKHRGTPKAWKEPSCLGLHPHPGPRSKQRACSSSFPDTCMSCP